MRVTSGRSVSTSALTRSIPATPIVLICTQTAPGASAATIPWSRAIDNTTSASVTIVTTMSARRAASASVSATSAPRSVRSRVAAGSRFQTIVGMPARKALLAIACPIVPMPTKATGSFAGAIGSPPSAWVHSQTQAMTSIALPAYQRTPLDFASSAAMGSRRLLAGSVVSRQAVRGRIANGAWLTATAIPGQEISQVLPSHPRVWMSRQPRRDGSN